MNYTKDNDESINKATWYTRPLKYSDHDEEQFEDL